MIKIERILVPVDFSQSSETALRYAREIARDRGAKLYVLHVIHQRIIDTLHHMSAMGYKGEFPEVLTEVTKERMEELNRFFPQESREGMEVEFEVQKGRPAEQVIKMAREKRIDLIILGTLGRSSIEAVLLGSVARHVTNHAPCPVLLVRPVQHDFIQ